jgi:hypothetical protein
MSLKAANYPPLVASVGALTLCALPALEQAIVSGTIPWTAVKVTNCLLYALNVYATGQPGRIDGIKRAARVLSEGEDDKKKEHGDPENPVIVNEHTPLGDVVDERNINDEDMDPAELDRRARTLVAPSGWAFAIWGPIFIGEFVFCASHLFLAAPGSSSAAAASGVSEVVRRASGGFMASQWMQTLWTASFRPKYKGKYVFVSGFLLSGIAISLSRAHAAFTINMVANSGSSYDNMDYWLYFLPMTMHFGWTTAAMLVNWNGSIASTKSIGAKGLAVVGHVSVVIATAAGVGITLSRGAPVFGLVIAWALSACAAGMKQRLEPDAESSNENYFRLNRNKNNDNDKDDDGKEAGVYGAKVQRYLCLSGAVLSASASSIALWSMRAK